MTCRLEFHPTSLHSDAEHTSAHVSGAHEAVEEIHEHRGVPPLAAECLDGSQRRDFTLQVPRSAPWATPATTRFLSIEPLLGPVGELDLDGIDWVIVGGESGHGEAQNGS